MPTLNEVYRKFGETAEAAQLLETELGNVVLGIEGKKKGLFDGSKPDIAKKLMSKVNKSTLGQLTKHVRAEIGTDKEIEKKIQKALKHRNKLMHSFYREHNFRRNSDDGRSLMIEDLEVMHKEILDGYVAALAIQGQKLEDFEDISSTKHVQI